MPTKTASTPNINFSGLWRKDVPPSRQELEVLLPNCSRADLAENKTSGWEVKPTSGQICPCEKMGKSVHLNRLNVWMKHQGSCCVSCQALASAPHSSSAPSRFALFCQPQTTHWTNSIQEKWGYLNTLHLLQPCPQVKKCYQGSFLPSTTVSASSPALNFVCIHCLAKSFYWFSNFLLISCTLINNWTQRNLAIQSKYGLRRQRKNPKLGLLGIANCQCTCVNSGIEILLSLQCKILRYKILWQLPMEEQDFFSLCRIHHPAWIQVDHRILELSRMYISRPMS